MNKNKSLLLLSSLAAFGLCLSCTTTKKASIDMSSALIIEAEDGGLYGVNEASEFEGYNGSSYVNFTADSQGVLEFYADVESEGDYCVFIKVLVEEMEEVFRRPMRLQLEQGEKIVTSQRLPETGMFDWVQLNAVVHLEKGSNVFYLGALGGEFNVDQIAFIPANEALAANTKPSSKLVNPKATKNAKALYEYLCSIEGKGILSGQQIYTRAAPEIKVLYETTGKYPAVLGIDLIDYSPSRVAYGTSSAVVSNGIKWWKEGGIVSVCWHWNAPNGLVNIDEKDKHWYDGFRPSATTFDFSSALINPDGQDYKDLIRDIDAIAVQLKKLQDAGVPLLWRPLHEASGGWFWWGAADAKSYIKLYRLMYDRLTNYHKLNNLIWVWNGQDAEWYPGDDVVDIISYDSYPGAQKYVTQEHTLSDLRSASAQPKIMAISENGALPDVNALSDGSVPWTWFCTWDGEFTIDKSNKYSEKHTKKDVLLDFYNNPYLITRDEVPSLNVE